MRAEYIKMKETEIKALQNGQSQPNNTAQSNSQISDVEKKQHEQVIQDNKVKFNEANLNPVNEIYASRQSQQRPLTIYDELKGTIVRDEKPPEKSKSK